MSPRPFLLFALPLALLLGACRDGQADTLRQQNSQLQAQLQGLQTQVTDLKGQLTRAETARAQAEAAARQNAGSGTTSGLAALQGELAWRQAQGYAVAVHAAFAGRMAEDPMYTPDRLAGEVPDCLKAGEVGDRTFGAPPRSVTACTVEADGQDDVRVTVRTAGKTFVNGVEGGE